MRRFFWFILLVCNGCYLTGEVAAPLPQLAAATPTIATLIAQDAAEVMAGICFEAAQDAAGQVFTLRDAEAHIRFYDLADNSQLCRRPVERVPFDFSTGRILAGLWSAGEGCTARHVVESMNRDDEAKTVNIRVRFITEGNCNYQLVQPFWRTLDGVSDYDIEITVEE